MQKKAQLGIIIGIIIFFLVIAGLITILIIAVQKGVIFKKQEAIQPVLNLFLLARDSKTLNSTDADYSIDYTYESETIFLSKGKLSKDSWTEIQGIHSDKLIHISCWNKDYYLVKVNKQFSQLDISSNTSKTTCDMPKIGDLEISYKGDLSKENNEIVFNITPRGGKFSKISMAFSWTPGIIDVTLPNQVIICDKGDWLNYSYYNATSKKFTYLPENNYRCGECEGIYCEQTEICEYAENNKCKTFNEEIPLRFRQTYDSAYYFGKSLQEDESYEILINVKTLENKNQLDALTITFYDKDRRWDEIEQRFLWKSELNGGDIGAEDKTITITYV